MASLFTFSLGKLAKAIAGRASLRDTDELFTLWPQQFPTLEPQEQQLDRSEFAVYLTAVARESRALHGANWNRPAGLKRVRDAFLDSTSPLGPAATSRRVLGPVTAGSGARRGGARRSSRKTAARKARPARKAAKRPRRSPSR